MHRVSQLCFYRVLSMFMCDCFRTAFLSDQIPLHQEEKRCPDTAYVNSTPEGICKNRCRYRLCAFWSAFLPICKLFHPTFMVCFDGWSAVLADHLARVTIHKGPLFSPIAAEKVMCTCFRTFFLFFRSSGLQDASGIHFALMSFCPAKAHSLYKVLQGVRRLVNPF